MDPVILCNVDGKTQRCDGADPTCYKQVIFVD
jgi:hypothetical protein